MKSFLTALACCVCVSLPVHAHEEPGDEFNSLIASLVSVGEKKIEEGTSYEEYKKLFDEHLELSNDVDAFVGE